MRIPDFYFFARVAIQKEIRPFDVFQLYNWNFEDDCGIRLKNFQEFKTEFRSKKHIAII